jgi:hypothetical protein
VILRTRLWKCQADVNSLLAIRASGSSSATAKPHIPTIEVTIAVTVDAIPSSQQYVIVIEVTITVTVDPIPSSQQYVIAIKVTIAVTVNPSLTPKTVVIVVAVAPPAITRDVATSVWPTSVPAAIAGIVTIHKLLGLLVLPAATSTPLRESKHRHRYHQNQSKQNRFREFASLG